MASLAFSTLKKPTVPVATNNPLTDQYKLYNTAVQQNAEDYSGLMGKYNTVFDTAQSQAQRNNTVPQLQQYKPTALQAPTQISPVMNQLPNKFNPELYSYAPTQDYQSAVGVLKNLAETGGYSAADIANLRERGISPIRSVYSAASRNLNRSRALQGGYSPSYGALNARMAREQSEQMANQMTKVNADLAQHIAANKLAIAPTYANTTAAESALQNQYGQRQIDTKNEASRYNLDNQQRVAELNTQLQNLAQQINAQMQNEVNRYNTNLFNDAAKYNAELPIRQYDMNRDAYTLDQNSINQMLQALNGQQSLYGTTPALSATFGNQALSAAQLQNMINQQGNQNGLQLLAQLMRAV